MKRFFLTIALLWFVGCVIESSAQKQVQLSDYYKNYYRISDKAEDKTWDMSGGHRGYPGNIYGYNGTHNGDNQKWLIMPTYPGSNEFIIVNKANGGVVDIHNDNNLYVYNDYFHGKDNQVFKFIPVGNGYFFIGSGTNSQYVLDRSYSGVYHNPFESPSNHRDNIYFGASQRGSNQQFKFWDVDDIRNTFTKYIPASNESIGTPAKPTDMTGKGMCRKCNETVVGETIIPFTMVRNDMSRNLQLKNSPYYKLVRTQFWRMLGSPRLIPAGYSTTYRYEQYSGITQNELSEVVSKLNIGFTIQGEIGFNVAKSLSAKVSSSLSTSLEINRKHSVSYEREQYEKQIHEIKYAVDVRTLYAEYQLVDHYKLYRADGSLAMEWDVEYGESSNSRSAYTDSDFKDGKSGDIIEKSWDEKTRTYSVQRVQAEEHTVAPFAEEVVHPNPFIHTFDVQLTVPEACNIEAVLYDKQGNEVKRVNEVFSEKGIQSLTFQGHTLAKGMYILKVYMQSLKNTENIYEHEERIIKE